MTGGASVFGSFSVFKLTRTFTFYQPTVLTSSSRYRTSGQVNILVSVLYSPFLPIHDMSSQKQVKMLIMYMPWHYRFTTPCYEWVEKVHLFYPWTIKMMKKLVFNVLVFFESWVQKGFIDTAFFNST